MHLSKNAFHQMHFRLTVIIMLNPRKMQQKVFQALALCHARSTSRSSGGCSRWSLAGQKKSELGGHVKIPYSTDVLTWLCIKADLALWLHSPGKSRSD